MELYPPVYTTKNTDNHCYHNYTSCHPTHMKKFIIFSQLLRYKRICSEKKDFIKHSKELVTHFLHIGYPIMVNLKQWDEANKVHRSSLFTHREKTIDNHIPLVQTYHPTIVSTNKSVIKEWKLYSYINSAKHLFCNSPVCAYRQRPNLKRMLIKSNHSRIPTLVGNSKCMKPRCQVCDMLDTQQQQKIREQALPFYLETTIVILVTLSIYSCVTNVTLEITSETSNKLRLKKCIRDSSRGFPVAVHLNQPDHLLKM